MTNRMMTTLAVAAVAGGAVALPALAQEDFPERPVTLVIPLGAGGSHDLNARAWSSVISDYLGQPMIVRLMPGASGQTGTAEVANARPDGYTLLLTHNYIDQLQPLIQDVPYDTLEDFVTVARPNYSEICLVVRSDSDMQTFEDFATKLRESPDEMEFSHSGPWGAVMVPGVQVAQALGVTELNMTAYDGGGPSMMALVQDDSTWTMQYPSTVLSQGDRVRALACAAKNEQIGEDIPTFEELGIEGDIGIMHRPVLAPAGTPPERIEILEKAFSDMQADATLQRLMTQLGENMEYMSGDDYEELRRQQREKFQDLVDSLQ